MVQWYTIIWIMIIVLVNSFFVAFEIALVNVRQVRIDELARQGSRSAKRVQKMLEDLDDYLITVQLGVTFTSLALGVVGEPFFQSIFEPVLVFIGLPTNTAITTTISVVISYLALTYIHMSIGEIAPKSAAIRLSETVALHFSFVIYWLSKIAKYWLIRPLNFTTRMMLFPFGIDTKKSVHLRRVASEDELKLIIAQSGRLGVLEEKEEKLINRVLEFTDMTARELMTPRISISALPSDATVEEILQLAKDSGHSRFPVYKDDLESIIGSIHIKDVMTHYFHSKEEQFVIETVLREILIIPEIKHAAGIMLAFQESKSHIAVVVDEYGSVSGIVTIEDVVEAIFGPIEDEFDEDPDPIAELPNGNYLIDGATTLDEFNEVAGTKISAEDSITVAGYLLENLEHIPEEGEQYEKDNIIFRVEELENRRIRRIRVWKKDVGSNAEEHIHDEDTNGRDRRKREKTVQIPLQNKAEKASK